MPIAVLALTSGIAVALGDTVVKGEVIAVLESRELANAKSEYLATRLNF